MDITIGADPELFVSYNGEFVPACGMVPGTKANPMPVNHGTIQVDGLALEIGITPTSDARRFNNSLVTVMDQLLMLLPDGHAFTEASSATFKSAYWDKLTEDDKRLGCEPDFNAYTLSENPPPVEQPGFRVAGGHVHVGWTRDADVTDQAHLQACARVARNLDIYLGVPSLIEDKNGSARRKMYGAAGAFRPKSYGMEYRTLSNYWLFTAPLRDHIFNRTWTVMNNLLRYKIDMCEKLGQEVGLPRAQHIINTDDRDAAMALCRELDIGVQYA